MPTKLTRRVSQITCFTNHRTDDPFLHRVNACDLPDKFNILVEEFRDRV